MSVFSSCITWELNPWGCLCKFALLFKIFKLFVNENWIAKTKLTIYVAHSKLFKNYLFIVADFGRNNLKYVKKFQENLMSTEESYGLKSLVCF